MEVVIEHWWGKVHAIVSVHNRLLCHQDHSGHGTIIQVLVWLEKDANRDLPDRSHHPPNYWDCLPQWMSYGRTLPAPEKSGWKNLGESSLDWGTDTVTNIFLTSKIKLWIQFDYPDTDYAALSWLSLEFYRPRPNRILVFLLHTEMQKRNSIQIFSFNGTICLFSRKNFSFIEKKMIWPLTNVYLLFNMRTTPNSLNNNWRVVNAI